MSIIQWKLEDDLLDYAEALSIMEERVEAIIKKHSPELIWFVQHNHVYTAGSSALESEMLNPIFPVYNVGRGGKYTYHGPGQRVIYFLLDLKSRNLNITSYIWRLEEVIIRSLEVIGIKGFRRPKRVGIWVMDQKGLEAKIAAIGIRVRKYISYHGIAINLSPKLENFANITPCGISEYGVTSVENLGYNYNMQEFDKILQDNIKTILLHEE